MAIDLLFSVGLEVSEEDRNLKCLYWTLKLHKTPFNIVLLLAQVKCTTKDFSTIKDGLIRYCATKTSRNGVNNMWMLKNSSGLLSSLDARTATSVQIYNFSTLYTSIPHKFLKSRIAALIHKSFKKRDGSTRYLIKLDRERGTSLIPSMAAGNTRIHQIRYVV